MIVKPTEDVLKVEVTIYGVMMELVNVNMNDLNNTISRRNSSLFLPGMMYSIQARSISLAGNGSSTMMNFTTRKYYARLMDLSVRSTMWKNLFIVATTHGKSLSCLEIEYTCGKTLQKLLKNNFSDFVFSLGSVAMKF